LPDLVPAAFCCLGQGEGGEKRFEESPQFVQELTKAPRLHRGWGATKKACPERLGAVKDKPARQSDWQFGRNGGVSPS
jgi:hypothetical protein